MSSTPNQMMGVVRGSKITPSVPRLELDPVVQVTTKRPSSKPATSTFASATPENDGWVTIKSRSKAVDVESK